MCVCGVILCVCVVCVCVCDCVVMLWCVCVCVVVYERERVVHVRCVPKKRTQANNWVVGGHAKPCHSRT